MNRALAQSRTFPVWIVAAIVAGLVLAATISRPTAAAGTPCPGMALRLSDNTTDPYNPPPNGFTWGVDDDVEVYLNGALIYNDNNDTANALPPFLFTGAQHGDQLRVIASNSLIHGGPVTITSLALYCDATLVKQTLDATSINGQGGFGFGQVFYDKTFTIHFTAASSDVTAPTVAIANPPDGAVYLLGQVVLADYDCADEAGGSGVATCTGSVPDGAAIDTSTVGARTVTVTGTDNAGNTTVVTHNYAVVYDFSGFFQPVDNLPVVNTVNAGRAIPIKFSLNGDQGLAIFATGYPKSQTVQCASTGPVDGIEETLTAGSSSLSYDASLDQYSYVWKTEKSWAGTCRQLIVKLADGTSHRANFQFR